MPDPLIENINKMMRDGPRLRSDYNTWIEAKTDQGEVVVGGVGGQGMGAILVDDYFMAPGLTSASNDLGYREAPTIEAESAQEIGVARGAPRGATVDEEAARRHADWWLNGPTFVEGANHVREEMRKIETREHVGRMEFRNLESVEVPGWLWKARAGVPRPAASRVGVGPGRRPPGCPQGAGASRRDSEAGGRGRR